MLFIPLSKLAVIEPALFLLLLLNSVFLKEVETVCLFHNSPHFVGCLLGVLDCPHFLHLFLGSFYVFWGEVVQKLPVFVPSENHIIIEQRVLIKLHILYPLLEVPVP